MGHAKKCDQCDQPVPGVEGQGRGTQITPDSAISHEQKLGGSSRVKVDCPRTSGGGLQLRKQAMPTARGAISDRTARRCSPYQAPCRAVLTNRTVRTDRTF